MIGLRSPRDVHIHYHRPPNRTDFLIQRLVRDGPACKITFAEAVGLSQPLVIDEDVALEAGSDAVWFTFPGAWHDIGRFYGKDGTLTGIYANVLTPCVFEPGGVWHTTDLYLDLWIPAPGGSWESGASIRPRILDSEELDGAEVQGWVSRETAARARQEADRLVRAALRGSWPPAHVERWTRRRVLDVLAADRDGAA